MNIIKSPQLDIFRGSQQVSGLPLFVDIAGEMESIMERFGCSLPLSTILASLSQSARCINQYGVLHQH
jgi:hypothetical protein